MKKSILIIITVFIFTMFLTSCGLVLKTVFGIQKPRIETLHSLKKYMKRKHIFDGNVIATNGLHSAKKHFSLSGGVPDILIFNNKLENIIYKTPEQCNAAAFDAILSLDKQMQYPINEDSLVFKHVNSGLADLNGNPVQISMNDSADFLMVIYWAKYIGRLNKDHVNIWESNAAKNKKANIQVIKINLDAQIFWEESQKHFKK